MERVLALLYDIHGNLPALEAVLADAGDAGDLLLGGDYATAGAWPRRRSSGSGTRERHMDPRQRRPLAGGPPRRTRADRRDRARTAELLGDELVADLVELPEQTEIGDTLYCHASPHSDMQSFGAEPGPLDNELLAGVTAERVVFGHTHVQFQRTGSGGIELLNPGSVGMPWDGDHRAAYAVIDGDRVDCRRVEYDWEASVAAVRERVGELPARRMELARFDVS